MQFSSFEQDYDPNDPKASHFDNYQLKTDFIISSKAVEEPTSSLQSLENKQWT